MRLSQFRRQWLILLMGILSSAAQAWGPEGHQATGYIAQSLLTPEARIRLNEIMPAADLGQVATWMDDERIALKKTIPESAKWHFYNLPVCDNPAKKDICANGDCAVYRIDEYVKVLSNPTTTREDKVFAVRVIVHMVGDLHQPLHAGDNNNRGGNKLKVGEHSNLHSEWDRTFVKKLARGKNSKELAEELKTQYASEMKSWQTGDPMIWANESNQFARNIAYAKLPEFSCEATYLFVEKLPKSYVEQSQAIVQKRLAMGGARIAYVLNTALTESTEQ